MQGRKPEEEIQHVAISHVYAKISHSMQNQEEQMQDWVKDNFAHPTKPQDVEKNEFRTPCKILHGLRNLPVHLLR